MSQDLRVAIVGMAGRFPGASTVDELWADLRAGRPGIRPVTDDELAAAGVDPGVLADPRYVRVAAPLPDLAGFDAPFFGFTPAEAAATDPQHRLFLECCWEALESAGHRPDRMPGQTGVFAGSGFTTYLVRNLFSRPDVLAGLHKLQLAAGNDRDALPTVVSYKLGLSGPSVAVQSFCSTSLVAVHLAVQSLLAFESDVALAGGASIDLPHPAGYLYEDGGIVSPDGVVRSFDARATGTVVANGVGVVVLKRLEDAVRDGDRVRAVVLGSAMNNDGRDKVGYSAPGVDGQAAVIEDALRVSDVDPREIGYVECHATGTMLGDSVELSALRRAFTAVEADVPAAAGAGRAVTVLGSLKPTHGHLDRASGVSGLIRATLAVEHGVLPGTPNYAEPNPALAEAGERFAVLAHNEPWPEGRPRQASVSSFGLGGTNVHLVLAEAPAPAPRPPRPGPHLLVLSARTPAALDEATRRLRDHLTGHPDLDLADVAFTLRQSRSGFAVRRFAVCSDHADAVRALDDPTRWHTATADRRDPAVSLRLPDPGATPGPVWTDLARAVAAEHAEPVELVRLMLSAGLRLGNVTATGDAWADLDLPVTGTVGELTLEFGPGPVDSGASWLWQRIGELWLAGVEWDWSAFDDGSRLRVALPTYPFQRMDYWVDPGRPTTAAADPESDRARRADPTDWFYQPVWRARPLLARVDQRRLRESGPWLVFADDPVLRSVAAELAGAGADVVVARPGPRFARTATPNPFPEFTVRPDHPGDHEQLIATQGIPRTVLHGWALAPAPDTADRVKAFESAQTNGFHAVRATLRALANRNAVDPVDLVLVSGGALGVHGNDLVRPEHATLSGLVPVISQEYPHIRCRQSDMDTAAGAGPDLLAEVLAGTDAVVAHRAGRRWVRDHEPLPVPPADPAALDAVVPPGATVLITGGLGDVGLVLAEHLARTRSARLVLTANSPLPQRESWDEHLRRGDLAERTERRVKAVLALESAGAEVLAMSADVADPDAMAEVVRAAVRRFGGVDLIVHGSGVSDPAYFGTAAELTHVQAGAHFRAKIHGFLVLRDLLPGVHGITLSSLAAVLGGLAFAGYAGSNAALDAYAAHARTAGRGTWLTVDWEGWRVRTERHLAPGTTITDYPMRPAEALEVFDRALAVLPKVPHLVTSSGPLAARLADWVTGHRPTPTGPSTVDTPAHPRPPLSTVYEPPSAGAEDDVARVWSEVLGVDEVGAHDDFFELGGHSLLATRLVGRLQARLAVTVPVLTVLRHPTVRSLTRELVAARRDHRVEDNGREVRP